MLALIRIVVLFELLNGAFGIFHNGVVVMNISKWQTDTIPYKISSKFTSTEVSIITDVLKKISKTTCLKFVRRTHQHDFVHFKKTHHRGECGAKLGRVGGEQLISLAENLPHSHRNKDCISNFNVAKYVMRTLGFFPENLREDRDHYVKIIWENVIPNRRYDLQKIRGALFDLKMPYDYYSVLHQQANVFAIEKNKRTVFANPHWVVVFNRPLGLSWGDLAKIQRVYCPSDKDKDEDNPPILAPCEWALC